MNRLPGVTAFASLCLLAGSAVAADPPLLGTWAGPAQYQDEQAELILRFEPDPNGGMLAYMSLPRTNVADAPVGKVHEEAGGYRVYTARFRFDEGKAALIGEFDASGHHIAFELQKRDPATTTPAAVSKHTGVLAKPAWAFRTGGPVWSSPTLAGNVVYIGSDDGQVYALNARRGDELWNYRTGAPVVARPTIVEDALYVASDDGYLYKLGARSGRLLWRRDLHGAAVPRVRPSLSSGQYDYLASAPVVAGDTVFVGSADGRLYAVDAASGKEKWHHQTGGLVRSTPVVVDGVVYFGSFDHHVYALRADGGQPVWDFDSGDIVNSSPVVADGKVYIGSRSTDVFALDAATGKPAWKYYYWMSWVESSGSVRDGTLYVGSSDYQRLYALDAASGKARWFFDTDGSAWSSPAVTDGRVYIGSAGTVGYMTEHRGGFFAVDRSDGHELWRYPMAPIAGSFTYGVVSSPAVGQGRVYFGGLDGLVYAFPEISTREPGGQAAGASD